MILYRWQGRARNFGDELNTVLWPSLLPGFFDDDPATRFLGIGSILDLRHQGTELKLVAGSGYGGYEPPARLGRDWDIHWVRGPRTARILGLPPALGLGDPAILLPCTGLTSNGVGPAQPRTRVGFMPHFESAAGGAWDQAAAATGITLIDPRGDPLAITAAISRCSVLLSEALHGVIVADTLRVPWIAIEPQAAIHRSKWLDWAESLKLTIDFHRVCPSSLLERARLSRLTSFHAGRCLLDRHAYRLRRLGAEYYIHHAARALRQAALAAPQLSCRHQLERCQNQMLDKLDGMRRAHLRPSP